MIIVMQPGAGEAEIQAVEAKILAHGLSVHVSRGTERTLIGAVGDERVLDPEMFDPMPGVEKSMHIVKQYKIVAREWHRENTVIDVAGVPIGGPTVQRLQLRDHLADSFPDVFVELDLTQPKLHVVWWADNVDRIKALDGVVHCRLVVDFGYRRQRVVRTAQ